MNRRDFLIRTGISTAVLAGAAAALPKPPVVLEEIRFSTDCDVSAWAYLWAEGKLRERGDEPSLLLTHPRNLSWARKAALGRVLVQSTDLFTSVDAWALLGQKYAVYSDGA